MPPELLELLRSGGAGLAPVFGILWWLERSERIGAQKDLNELGERAYTALEGARLTLEGFKALFQPGRNTQ